MRPCRLGRVVGDGEHFGAGFAPKGIMRGRFAIPSMIPPASCSPTAGARSRTRARSALPQRLRSAHRDLQCESIVEGDLFLVRDPLQVLTAHESGIENVVAFLTENVTALQLEQLAALMDERKCEHMEMF